MRNKFIDLVQAGVAKMDYNPIAGNTPSLDPLVVMYNRYWGLATDTHCALVGGRYIVTGHWLTPPAGQEKTRVNKAFNTLVWNDLVNGVDVKPSGFWSLGELLRSVNKEAKLIQYNGDIAMEFTEAITAESYKGDAPEVCYPAGSNIAVPLRKFESVPGTFHEMYNRYENGEQLAEALNESAWMKGKWMCSGSQLACRINETVYVTNLELNESQVCKDESCPELKELLSKADLQDVALVKAKKGFKLDSDNRTWKRLLAKNKYNHINVDDYSDLTPEEWFKAIKDIVNTID